MPDWPSIRDVSGRQVHVAGTRTTLGVGPQIGSAAPSSAAWPGANTAIYIPFRVSRLVVAQQIVLANGATVSGNFDTGIYDAFGNQVVSSGATAHAGINTKQVVNITDTPLGRGLYYLALSFDNATATTQRNNALNIGLASAMGVYNQATAYPLPAAATFASATSTYIPDLSAWMGAQ